MIAQSDIENILHVHGNIYVRIHWGCGTLRRGCVGAVKCGCAPVLRLLHGSSHLRKHVGNFWYMDRVGVAVSADDTVRVESPTYGNRGHGGGGLRGLGFIRGG